jgi:hypothetical protein
VDIQQELRDVRDRLEAELRERDRALDLFSEDSWWPEPLFCAVSRTAPDGAGELEEGAIMAGDGPRVWLAPADAMRRIALEAEPRDGPDLPLGMRHDLWDGIATRDYAAWDRLVDDGWRPG